MKSFSVEVGSRFIASTMHEIRTPLQTIIGTLELLEDTPLNKEQIEYVRQIEFSVNALLGLANDVLDFTKITSTTFKLELCPYDVAELAERTVDLISFEAFNKGLELITDIDYKIGNATGDSKRVQQVLLNLIKNAVKFTDTGYILVRIKEESRNLCFEIVDTGIGVDDDKKELIFTDFYQVDGSPVKKNAGAGLGLSISRNLVSVMNGKIGVTSNPGGGSTFWFKIPFEKFEYEKEESFADSNLRVLIVDDNNLALEAMKSKLDFFGVCDVELADSGKEGISRIKKSFAENHIYDLILVDLSVSHTDSWNFASEAVYAAGDRKLNIYLMIPEGLLRQDSKMKLLNFYSGYIYKPVKKSALEDVLKSVSSVRKNGKADIENPAHKMNADEEAPFASGIKILVAEDTEVNKILIGSFLKKFGAEVIFAENGQVAIDKIKENPDTDIVFMDIFMPVKSGLDATVEIRSNGYKGVIIACTANNDSEDFEIYKKTGINDIIVKPFKRSALKDILEKWKSVFNVPNGKEMINLSYIEKTSAGIWDIKEFMDDVAEHNQEFAISLMDEYIGQTEILLEKLKYELSEKEMDFNKIELFTHTLKGSSAAVCATRFSELGRMMNESAKKKNLSDLENARISFEIDFVTLKKLVESWKTSIC